jgi:hypothetical protein
MFVHEYIGANWVESLFSSPPSHRTRFLTGVHFFFGISAGSFVSTVVMDGMYGFPVSVKKLIVGLVVCLWLCWAMVFFYDIEEKRSTLRRILETAPSKAEIPATPRKNRTQPRKAPSELLEPLIV